MGFAATQLPRQTNSDLVSGGERGSEETSAPGRTSKGMYM